MSVKACLFPAEFGFAHIATNFMCSTCVLLAGRIESLVFQNARDCRHGAGRN